MDTKASKLQHADRLSIRNLPFYAFVWKTADRRLSKMKMFERKDMKIPGCWWVDGHLPASTRWQGSFVSRLPNAKEAIAFISVRYYCLGSARRLCG